jgi:hypothetical protein
VLPPAPLPLVPVLLPLVPVLLPLVPVLLPLVPELPLPELPLPELPLDCANNEDVRKPAKQIASCAMCTTLFILCVVRDKLMRRACSKYRIDGSGGPRPRPGPSFNTWATLKQT